LLQDDIKTISRRYQLDEPETETETETETELLPEKYSDDYENLWKTYHRKGSKKLGYNEWKKLRSTEKKEATEYAEILVTHKMEKNELQYLPDIERYLKRKLWEGKKIEEEKKNG
jgi:hypothetical protein